LTQNGKSPFADWLTSLKDIKTRAIVRVRLDRLRLGNWGDCKSVGEGVQELRIDFGPGYRVYLGQEGDVVILLLCGGSKKSQSKDIEKANQYWHDYQERSHG